MVYPKGKFKHNERAITNTHSFPPYVHRWLRDKDNKERLINSIKLEELYGKETELNAIPKVEKEKQTNA